MSNNILTVLVCFVTLIKKEEEEREGNGEGEEEEGRVAKAYHFKSYR